MNRNLSWASGLFDEIELVYEKAENNEKLQEELFQLEKQALLEAEEACSEGGLFAAEVGQTLTSEQFQAMAEIDKETAIVMLSQRGLSGFDVKRGSATIIAKFSTQIQRMLACTIMGLLNRLEKMDGSAQVTSPKWTLVLLVPLEGKKNLFRWEMLIMQLYPWISVQETSTNEIAEQNEETIAGEYTVVKKYPSNSMVEMMFVKDKEGVLQIIKRYDIKDHANALDQVIKYYQDLSKIRHSCMDYIIDKCTKRNPKERYQSVEELLNDLACYKELPRKENILTRLRKCLKKDSK